jgi:hypothetical protein
VVGSIVSSITSVRTRPPSVLPIILSLLRFAGARVADGEVLVARELTGLVGRDSARPELPDRGLSRQELVYDVGIGGAR